MRVLRKIYLMIFHIIGRLLAFVEFFLFLRLVLKFLNASSEAIVVNFIYKGSEVLISPFESMFSNIHWRETYLIETATVSAMVGYAILVYVIFQLLRFFSRR